MSSNQGFCTFCLNAGKDKQDCYGHYPGKDCPTLGSIECNRCGEKGHTRGHCTADFCRFCKGFGHLVNDCEKLKEKIERDKNAYCSFCEENGHTTRRCDNPYNSRNIK